MPSRHRILLPQGSPVSENIQYSPTALLLQALHMPGSIHAPHPVCSWHPSQADGYHLSVDPALSADPSTSQDW